MIGILTFHRAVNYGAVLQCYALQQTLNDLGISNKVIDYRCEYIERHYSPKPSVSIRHIRRYFAELLEANNKYKSRKKFDEFLNSHLKLSEPIKKSDLKIKTKEFETVIVGSDQVWNMLSTNGDASYFLDFVQNPTKKLSYAASVGTNDWNLVDKNTVRDYLKEYDVISVREPKAVDVIREVYDGKIVKNVDPTVLVDCSKWNELASKSKLNYKSFIFLYVMQPSDDLYKLAEKLSEKYGLKIISISMTQRRCEVGNNVKGMSVYDFVWCIKNARFIVTNSFHGLIFSMKYKKEFFWNYQSGNNMSNVRFDMLVEQYGIDIRCYDQNKRVEDYHNLNYELVEATMKKQSLESVEYLKSSVVGD